MRNTKFWGDKRYYSLDYYLKEQFGKKIYKLSINGGMTCPNRDGTIDNRGCIFCSAGGSGDFSTPATLSITEQIEEAKKLVSKKINSKKIDAAHVTHEHNITKNGLAGENSNDHGFPNLGSSGQYIAYFQAYTNTYANINYLRKIYTEAINHKDIVALSIATRPDCLGDDVLGLLAELNQIKPIWVELGLQTKHEITAEFIRRGYPLSVFEKAVHDLNKINLNIIVHVILGLPGESRDNMLSTISYVSSLRVQGIKLQLLHILKNTDLADYTFTVLSMDDYIDILISALELIPKNIVIHRITGDGPKDQLIAPMWSANKKKVLNTINQELKLRDTWQGKLL
ncbi:MAG: family radical protein [Anaerocolumna sp.]|nr:family radical protein [Anaerocolumna sp.]